MNERLASMFALLLVACAPELSIPPGSAADARSEPAPPRAGSGVLLASFDPDTLAPAEPRSEPAAEPAGTVYTCPHHPEVQSDKPGRCPKCGMPLEPKKGPPGGDPHAGHDHGAHP